MLHCIHVITHCCDLVIDRLPERERRSRKSQSTSITNRCARTVFPSLPNNWLLSTRISRITWKSISCRSAKHRYVWHGLFIMYSCYGIFEDDCSTKLIGIDSVDRGKWSRAIRVPAPWGGVLRKPCPILRSSRNKARCQVRGSAAAEIGANRQLRHGQPQSCLRCATGAYTLWCLSERSLCARLKRNSISILQEAHWNCNCFLRVFEF